jgi:uncharacterized membrane protein
MEESRMDERLNRQEPDAATDVDEAPNGASASPQRDYRMDLLISYVLRGGVLLSAGLLILGALLYGIGALRGGTATPPTTYPHSVGDVISGLARGDPLAVLSLGLLVLLLTPVARVVISIVAFARERDRLYVAITSLVLLILLVSFLLGKGGV